MNSYNVIMPKLGHLMTQGKIVKWLKSEGDSVKKGENLLEIMTDKITVTVESPESGVLSRILAKEGEVVRVGITIALINTCV